MKWSGTALLGTSYKSSILIEDQIADRASSKSWQLNESLKTVTDQKGIARIPSMPLIRTADRLTVHHPDYETSEATFLKIPADEQGVIHLQVKLDSRGRPDDPAK